ncbi:MAG: stage II sporulation protein R [Lachnospiraceae bacterium]|nr:stage II sporulation protein R [Lachnospiraceae bacterium]
MDYKIKFTKEKTIILISVAAGFILTAVICFLINAYSAKIQGGIAEKIIRLHVVANSDSDADQSLKLKVRDAVLEASLGIFEESKEIKSAREAIKSNESLLIAAAKNTIKSEGFDYDVNIFLSSELFPEREYGKISFPAGVYEALRINIGEGKGHNWWCVMYPPLCYVDASVDGVCVSEEELKSVLTDEEYEIASAGGNGESMPKIKLKIVEWWQKKINGGGYVVYP